MRPYLGQYLPERPAFLLLSELPYDDLLKGPGKVAGRLGGRTFRSVEGGEAPRGHVLSRGILRSVEFLFASR